MEKKKKVGIITFHNAHNYGAMLQVFALQKVLSEKYETKVIDYRNDGIEKLYKVIRINQKSFLTKIKSIIASIIYYRRLSQRYKIFSKFLKENIHLTKRYDTEKELQDMPPDFDVYITGSDQVWNYDISANKIDAYTLNFGKGNIRKISYAASIGTESFDQQHEKEYISRIEKLDVVSVREKKAKDYLEKCIQKKIEVTLDPTLLMTADEWNQLIDLENKEKEKYIFSYMVAEDPEYYKVIEYLSEKTGLKVVHASKRNKGIKNILRNAYTDGPIEFIKLIKNAEYVIATSFHATVFSIIFHKKFWIIPPKKTSARITDLLKMLKIENRAIDSLEQLKEKKYDEEINYSEVDKKLEIQRENSLNFLDHAIQ